MWDGIPVATILGTASPWAITATFALVIVRLIYTGKLVPYSTLLLYKEALAEERAANAELRAALASEKHASAGTVTHLLESLQKAPQGGDDS